MRNLRRLNIFNMRILGYLSTSSRLPVSCPFSSLFGC
jgi:hypothetical protein